MGRALFAALVCCALLGFMGVQKAEAKAYGPLTQTLYAKFCNGSTWKKWGCKGYFHYRLDWNRKRSGAMSACNWSCGKQAGNKGECKAGCQLAKGYDNN